MLCQHARSVNSELRRLQTEAHIWLTIPHPVTDAARLAYESQLAPCEQEQYKKYYFNKDRVHYLVAHVLVRQTLSRYVNKPPKDWLFTANDHGRPEIVNSGIDPILRFNLTHTNGLCACIVTQGLDCGIDAEDMARNSNLRIIADKMFEAPERDAMGSLDCQESRECFFRSWTLREAYCKAQGTGIAATPRNYYFDDVMSDRPTIRYFQLPSDADQWQFALLKPTDSHLLAVALHRPDLVDKKIVVRMA